jgi:hypothetical protein
MIRRVFVWYFEPCSSYGGYDKFLLGLAITLFPCYILIRAATAIFELPLWGSMCKIWDLFLEKIIAGLEGKT